MWIDSDSVFEPDDFFKLLYVNKDIVTGLVPMNTDGTAAAGLVNNCAPTKYIKMSAISKKEERLLDIDFCGFAFVLIKYGVFESIDYTWIRFQENKLEKRIILPTEDVTWCIRATELGWKLYAHPQVRIGHEKEIILQA